jgi:hypothetical protein
MRTFRRLTWLALLLPGLAGCFTNETLIKVNADGSGTIENVILINESAMDGIGDMLGGKSTSGGSKGAPSMSFDEATLRAEAEKQGPGVRLVSTEPLTRGSFKGARIVYAFDDVNTLRVDQDPMPSAPGDTAKASAEHEPIALQLTRLPNGNSLLTLDLNDEAVVRPPVKKNSGQKMGKSAMPPELQEMVRQMFDGFRVVINVEPAGRIVRTSSPHATDTSVTILEMDLGRLMRDEENLKRLNDIEPGTSLPEMIPIFKSIKGMKVNTSPLTIEFAGR